MGVLGVALHTRQYGRRGGHLRATKAHYGATGWRLVESRTLQRARLKASRPGYERGCGGVEEQARRTRLEADRYRAWVSVRSRGSASFCRRAQGVRLVRSVGASEDERVDEGAGWCSGPKQQRLRALRPRSARSIRGWGSPQQHWWAGCGRFSRPSPSFALIAAPMLPCGPLQTSAERS